MTEATVRVRLPTKFPATVTADSPIVLTQTGGAYAFSLDLGAVGGTLQDFADDTAAASGGIPVSGMYRTASVVKVRVT